MQIRIGTQTKDNQSKKSPAGNPAGDSKIPMTDCII